jgi:glycosyltransferase involved in cell wall biosynthesis
MASSPMSGFLVPAPRCAVQPAAFAPSFAVVVPAYQAAATIADAVESALGQTVSPEEVIIVDDGSTDGTSDLLSPYRDRITLLQKSNGGGASALNVAIEAASSDFIVVLDSDDAYLPERIEELRRLAVMRPDLDLLSTDAYFESEGQITGRFNRANPFPVSDQREAMLRSCYLFAPAIRRRRLLEIGGFDEQLRIAYDWDCWIRVLLAGAQAGLVDRPLMRYRLHPGSLSADRRAALEERVVVLRKLASGNHSLSAAEAATLQRSLTIHRSTARLARAQIALLRGLPGARRYALRVALGRGFPPRTRARALLAAVAPGRAAKVLAREAETGASASRLLARPTGHPHSPP